MLTQTASILPVLRFRCTARPKPGQERESLMLYEPDSTAVFDAIIPNIWPVSSTVPVRVLPVSEGARRTSMDAATKNAGEMVRTSGTCTITAPARLPLPRRSTEIVAGADIES